MGFETRRFVDDEHRRMRGRRLHPVWRGVGCLVMIALGVLGYFLSGMILEANFENHWVYIPPEIYHPSFAPWLPPGAFLRIIVGLIAVALGYTVVNVLYAVLFPIKLGDTDMPPMRPSDRRKL
jgi:uncharacterized membrane protein YeaQ/YmgE (transglycosylase-associated protein family)